MTISNALRVFKNILYRLRHRYGFDATLRVKDTNPVFDPVNLTETNANDADYAIKKVVQLPRSEKLDFEYDLSYIAAGKNFVYGAFFAKHDMVVIIDKFTLRNSDDDGYYTIRIGDHLVIDSEIYEIASTVRLKENLGYILGLTHINSDTTE